jgi:hypothetical protein
MLHSKLYSNIARLLTSLLKKVAAFTWNKDAEQSFQQLKMELTSPTLVLQYPDFEKPFFLYTDASDQAIGAILQQKDNNNNKFTQTNRLCRPDPQQSQIQLFHNKERTPCNHLGSKIFLTIPIWTLLHHLERSQTIIV